MEENSLKNVQFCTSPFQSSTARRSLLRHHRYASATTRLSATLAHYIGRNLNETCVLLIRPYTLFAFTMGVTFIRRPMNPASRTYFKLYSSQQFVHCVVNPIILALAQKVCSSRRVFQAKVHARLRTLIAGQQLPLFVCLLNSCFIDATATACNYSGNNARTNRLRHVLHVLLNSCIV